MNNTAEQDQGVTESPIPLPSSFVYPVATCHILIVAVAVIGNIMVCSAILINKNLRKMPTNVFIFSLASSDLLTATLAMPFDIEGLFLGWVWNHGEAICRAWITVYLITVPTSILTLLAVSLDRYKSLSDPLNRYRRLGFMTHKRAIVISLMIWLYSILFALLPIMGWRTARKFVEFNVCWFPFPPVYTALSSTVNFILPLTIACGIHLKIYRLVCRQLKNFNTSQRAENNDSEPSEGERKIFFRNVRAFKTTTMFVCAIFLCWVPYSSVSIVAVLCESCAAAIPSEARVVLVMIGYLNSALNPFLFAFRSKRFKAVYPNVFGSPRRVARVM